MISTRWTWPAERRLFRRPRASSRWAVGAIFALAGLVIAAQRWPIH